MFSPNPLKIKDSSPNQAKLGQSDSLWREQVGLGMIIPSLTNHPYVVGHKHNQTKAERIFKRILLKLLNEQFPEYKHCLQTQVPFKHPKGFYILDFYIGQLKLAFEIDGGYHWKDKQLDKDLKRDHFFNSIHKVVIKHIGNNDILHGGKRRNKTLEDIRLLIIKRMTVKRNFHMKQKDRDWLSFNYRKDGKV